MNWNGYFAEVQKSHNGGHREWQVQINEEAQKYVEDFDLNVIVQIFEETPADLSLGKLCSEHGYSHEWTKDCNIIICTRHNLVFLVVSGLKSSSRSSSTFTSRVSQILPGTRENHQTQ